MYWTEAMWLAETNHWQENTYKNWNPGSTKATKKDEIKTLTTEADADNPPEEEQSDEQPQPDEQLWPEAGVTPVHELDDMPYPEPDDIQEEMSHECSQLKEELLELPEDVQSMPIWGRNRLSKLKMTKSLRRLVTTIDPIIRVVAPAEPDLTAIN